MINWQPQLLTTSSWRRHQMETFSALLALCAGNSLVTGEVPHKGQWHGALMFSLICAWINAWVNNREAGDLRRHHAHYDDIVMWHCHPYIYLISFPTFYAEYIPQIVHTVLWSVFLWLIIPKYGITYCPAITYPKHRFWTNEKNVFHLHGYLLRVFSIKIVVL